MRKPKLGKMLKAVDKMFFWIDFRKMDKRLLVLALIFGGAFGLMAAPLLVVFITAWLTK